MADPSPFPSASGRTGTVFGVPNVSEVDFKSRPLPFYSNSASCGTGIVFGTPKEPNFATGSDGSGVSSESNNLFQGSVAGAFGVSANLGFGIRPMPSFPSGPNSSGHGTSTSGFGVRKGPPFKYETAGPDCCQRKDILSQPSSLSGRMNNGFDTSASRFKFNFVPTPESQMVMAPKGSKVSPYSATKETSGSSGGKILSISGMEIYKEKSHEELRLEDYGLGNKGAQGGGFEHSGSPSNVFRFPSFFDQSSFNPPMEKFKFNPFAPKQIDVVTSSDTTSKAFPFGPIKPNPFSLKSQDSITSSDKLAKPWSFEPFKFNPFAPKQQDLVTLNVTNSTISSPIHPIPSSATVPEGSSMPTQPASVSISVPWPNTRHGSQPDQIKNPSQPTEDSLTMVGEVGYQNINGQQQYFQTITVGQQSPLTVPPFSLLSAIDRPKTTPEEHGISSLPASNNHWSKKNTLSTNQGASLLRVRHVSLRKNLLPASRFIFRSSEPKVPFFCDEVDRPGLVGPFLPRDNPRDWIKNSFSFHSYSGSKTCGDKDTPISFIRNSSQDQNPSIAGKTEADISSLMPKLPDGDDYYTEPSLTEIASKEKENPGSCTCVNGFVFGRTGYGSIRFLGETDVRNLDLGSIIQFNNREVIVYGDDEKPPVGQGLNKPAEVTLLNIKCTSKKMGKQYVGGPHVRRYREMLVKMAVEQGAEFVSYDAVRGEWKFRVQWF